ncbi:hypothetical protein ADUPG1_007421 [Aduncisulcus paluster]|uniref:DNA-directed RNA polymerase RBP11-like dimerisation domain-containing protein n=1 Tax=Aduncisulcus paluster TaxID=2918883 RepID=A0ABQ5KM16_9EUKA|nr:hypothetical protein ADUPG1_007421 [Aduncisulcus paluster]
MDNVPEREKMKKPDDFQQGKWFTITPIEKQEFTSEYKLDTYDHTVGNILRIELLNRDGWKTGSRDEKETQVLFAGYKQPHPLEPYIVLRIHTTGKSLKVLDAEDKSEISQAYTPDLALGNACRRAVKRLDDIAEQFRKAIRLARKDEEEEE